MEINPTELAKGEATLTQTLLEDGNTPPLHTQLSSQSFPQLEPLDALDSLPPLLRKDISDATRLAR